MKIGSGAGSLTEMFEGTNIRAGGKALGSVGVENSKGIAALNVVKERSSESAAASGDTVSISNAGREAAGSATVYTKGLKKTEAQKEQEEEAAAPESTEEIQEKMEEVQQQIQEAQQELQAAMSQASAEGDASKVDMANQKVQQLQTQLQQLQTQLMQAMKNDSPSA